MLRLLKFFCTIIFSGIIVLCSIAGVVMASYSSEPVNIRVALSSGTNIANFRVEQGSYKLIDQATGMVIGEPQTGEFWSIVKKGQGMQVERERIPLDFATFRGPLKLVSNNVQNMNIVSYSNNKYRDNLHFVDQTNGMLVKNVLELDKYLYGVVGPEMGNYAEMEALKAQAVASRSYALARINTNAVFDVSNDVNSQVYSGYNAEIVPGGHRVIEAVQATAGEVIFYNNQLVTAFFHSNAGGYTENSENVWSASLPYLKATPSPYDVYAFELPTQSSGWPASTYKWEKHFTYSEAQKMISQWNNNSKNNPQIGNLQNIVLQKLNFGSDISNFSGRVTELKIFGSSGAATAFKDQIRSVFGLRSTKFDIEMDSTVYIKNGDNQVQLVNYHGNLQVISNGGVIQEANVGSSNFVIKNKNQSKNVPKIFTTISFYGQGFGHGVGMSQWGARGMANAGYNYRQILEHYYNQAKQDGQLQIKKYY